MADPCQLAKACKNPMEDRRHAQSAYPRRHGVGEVLFLVRARGGEGRARRNQAPPSSWKDSARRPAVAQRSVVRFHFGGGRAHGAVAHYRVTRSSNLPIGRGEIYLIDSGGQYPDGTTDVTRTVVVGTPTDGNERPLHARLEGPYRARHRAVFPKARPDRRSTLSRGGRCGRRGWITITARAMAWAVICRYTKDRRTSPSGQIAQPLMAGMICSNEPGYYKAGEYGIRIENLVVVQEVATKGATAR